MAGVGSDARSAAQKAGRERNTVRARDWNQQLDKSPTMTRKRASGSPGCRHAPLHHGAAAVALLLGD